MSKENLAKRVFRIGAVTALLAVPSCVKGKDYQEIVAGSAPIVQPASQIEQPTVTPIIPEKPSFLDGLKSRLETEIGNYQGDIALAVVDLQNNKQIILGGEDEHLLGCTAKAFILLSVVRDLNLGKYPQDEELDYAIDQTMRYSDPYWTKYLCDKTSVAAVNETLKEIGTQKTTFCHSPEYWVADEDLIYGEQNLSTASDLALILSKVYQGEFLSRALSDYMIENMTHSSDYYDFNIIIPKLLPEGTIVAHKIGFFPDYPNTYDDAGIVITPKFSYVFVYLSQGNADWWAAPDFGAQLSKITYDAFSQEYGQK